MLSSLVILLTVLVLAPPATEGLPDASSVGRSARLRPSTPYSWPLDPVSVVRRFEPPPQPWLAGHRGVDLGGRAGAPVLAAGAGTVVFAGTVAGRGVVSIGHPGGLRTTYQPVTASELKAGAVVALGERIGTLDAGHLGCPVAACLHWGLRDAERYLDPLALLGYGRVRLLPLTGA